MPQVSGVKSELAIGLPQSDLVRGIGKSEGAPSSAFAEQLEGMVSRVNDAQQAADTKIEDVANGEDNDLHGTMIAMEQASVQLRLLTTVRDRALEAYREVMRMGA